MATEHEIQATPENVHWGIFDAALPPRLEIESGDRVTLHSISGAPEVTPDAGFHVPEEQRQLHRERGPEMPGHILTGPIAVRGAEPGEVLEVRILDVRLRTDWGWNVVRPLSGALPDEFAEERLLHIPLDSARMVGKLPWGVDLPLRPFFGVMGVAPPPAWGRITSIIPRRHGGNLDNKELIAGTTLFLPVHVAGANFSAGDGHAVQGDGEVCVSAIETALSGSFELIRRPDLALVRPRAETPSHYITMDFHEDLDSAARQALRDMIELIQERTNLSREDAYTLCSLAADLRITQMVNVNKGVHVMLAKRALHGPEGG